LVEKWNPPTRSETAEIGQKTKGILGVNSFLQGTFESEKLCFLVKHIYPLSFLFC
jgi:hypothetical protein